MSNPEAILAASEEIKGIQLFIPAVPELFWSAIFIIVIAVVFYRVVLPKLNVVLDERADKIEGGLKKAEEAQAQASALKESQTAELEAARTEAAKIREQARAEGSQILADLKVKAQSEADRIVASAHAQIQSERNAVVAQLHNELGGLATNLASKIVGASVADHAVNSGVVDRFIAELETANAQQGTQGAR